AQYFRQLPGIATIYLSSSEARTLLRIDESGVSKSVLVKLSVDEIQKLADTAGVTQNCFTKNYVIARERKQFVCMLNVKYDYTSHALPSEGGRLRELKPDTNWLTVSQELILPRPSIGLYPPIPYKMVYL
ncbi:MAG: hypothetical protein KAH09_05970, partial [Desulfobacula sp.]|nr:hypothetical protein [Desulfobacula sp.]